MEICEQNQSWAEEDGDLVFSHTKIILREGDQYYYTSTSRRYPDDGKADLQGLDIVPIQASHIWPPFQAQLGRAPEPLPQDYYVKQPRLIDYISTSTGFGDLLLHEAEVCEILRASPHPNIAQYLGLSQIVTKQGRFHMANSY